MISRFLLAILSVVASCSQNNNVPGSLSFQLSFIPRTKIAPLHLLRSTPQKQYMSMLDIPEEVTSIQLILSRENGTIVTDTSGQELFKTFSTDEKYLYLSGIPVESGLILTANGINSAALINYQMIVDGIEISEGQTTDLGILKLIELNQPISSTQPSSGTSTSSTSSAIIASISGTGTVSSPYLINTVAKFQALNEAICGTTASGCSSAIKLTSDLDFANETVIPLGSTANPFNGSLDGGGFTIRRVSIALPTTNSVGLVSALGPLGTIKNLNLTEAVIIGKNQVGMFAGTSEGTIENVQGSGTVGGAQDIGGLIGLMKPGAVLNSSTSQITVAATGEPAGGLVGTFEGGTASKCTSTGQVSSATGKAGGAMGYVKPSSSAITMQLIKATGNVSGITQVGGLIGEVSGAVTISTSQATGKVEPSKTTGGMTGGGLIGLFSGTLIEKSSATGTVKATGLSLTTDESGFGGLVGRMDSGLIEDAFATGSVSGVSSGGPAGGLVGQLRGGDIKRTLSTGAVSIAPQKGGVVGRFVSGSFTDVIWDTDTSGMANTYQGSSGAASGTTGKSTSDAKLASTYGTWNFSSIWTISEGNSYPTLIQTP